MPTPSPALPTLMTIMDRIDKRSPETLTATPEQVAAQIADTYRAQGMDRPLAVIQDEVDRYLAHPDAQEAPFTFGWDRPVDETQRVATQERIRRYVNWWGGALGPLLSAGGIFAAGGGLWAVGDLIAPWVGPLVGLGVFFGALGWGATKENACSEKLDEMASLEPHEATPQQLAMWQASPQAMRYLRACLLSQVPLLKQDVEILDQRQTQERLTAEHRQVQAAYSQIRETPP